MIVILGPSVTVTTCNILPPDTLRRNRLFLKLGIISCGFRTVSRTSFKDIRRFLS